MPFIFILKIFCIVQLFWSHLELTHLYEKLAEKIVQRFDCVFKTTRIYQKQQQQQRIFFSRKK